MTEYTIGSTYHGFTLKRMEEIAEIHSTVLFFEHRVLGTPALAIKNSDANKTFCIAFQTVPKDSTGVAHILEHSVLMGSKKYPVHDVFGEINKGGLMTFLNAMTGSDTTWYPFATRNMAEYFNIMDVYCDVTLNPLLERTTFEQEGWHYHKESMDAPLQFQGVVFNEMKGAFSDPIRALFHHMFKGLMPGSTYAHESGGDPRKIPDLNYEQFVEFHRRHYHPSNSMLFFYGDADLDRELSAVQENFLVHYDTAEDKASIVLGNDINNPVFIEDSYGVQPGSELRGKTFIAVGSSVGTVVDRKRNAAFQIIANILYNSDASPLKKAIIEANLCSDFGGMFLPNSCYKTFMMTYLVGCDPEKRERFLELYNKSLSRIVQDGIEHDLVLSELNKYEFSVREEINKAQRGLDLIGKALPAIKHGTDPFEALQSEKLFTEIRHQALKENYFEHLIRESLLDNRATVTVTLKPDSEKMSRTLAEEQKRLASYEQSLDAQELQQLVEHTRELVRLQHIPNDPETLSMLPNLELSDLDEKPSYHKVTPFKDKGTTILTSRLDTNSIVYFEIGLDCASLDAEQLAFLDLFGTIATEIGTDKRDYMRLAKDINIYTGGLSHTFSTYIRIEDNRRTRALLWFQVKTLSGYIKEAVALLGEILAGLDLDNRQRIREIVQREFAWAEHSVQSEGYSLATTRVFANLSRAGMLNEHVSGATAYLALKELAGNYDTREKSFLDTLASIRETLFRRSGLQIAVTGSKDDIERFTAEVPVIINALEPTPLPAAEPVFPSFPRSQGFCTSAEIVYNVQGCRLFENPSDYNGSFEVVKTWMSRDYLWNSVRQIGGAYGCFVQFSHITGNFGLVSYRDPQVAKTFQAYQTIGATLAELDLDRSVLDQLIIGTYGSLNPHQGPAAMAMTARNEYLSGITVACKQQRIREVIDTDTGKMRAFSPLFTNLQKDSFKASIGNCDKIKENKVLFDNIMEL
jgi:Zn-dependent M16 (insulinase) family peptidase